MANASENVVLDIDRIGVVSVDNSLSYGDATSIYCSQPYVCLALRLNFRQTRVLEFIML